MKGGGRGRGGGCNRDNLMMTQSADRVQPVSSEWPPSHDFLIIWTNMGKPSNINTALYWLTGLTSILQKGRIIVPGRVG